MRGGSILKQTLANGYIQLWEIQSIELGGEKEIGVVVLKSLTEKNTIDGVPVVVMVPSNLISSAVSAKILTVFNREEATKNA